MIWRCTCRGNRPALCKLWSICAQRQTLDPYSFKTPFHFEDSGGSGSWNIVLSSRSHHDWKYTEQREGVQRILARTAVPGLSTARPVQTHQAKQRERFHKAVKQDATPLFEDSCYKNGGAHSSNLGTPRACLNPSWEADIRI